MEAAVTARDVQNSTALPDVRHTCAHTRSRTLSFNMCPEAHVALVFSPRTPKTPGRQIHFHFFSFLLLNSTFSAFLAPFTFLMIYRSSAFRCTFKSTPNVETVIITKGGPCPSRTPEEMPIQLVKLINDHPRNFKGSSLSWNFREATFNHNLQKELRKLEIRHFFLINEKSFLVGRKCICFL